MVSSINSIMYNLELLNKKNSKVTYSLSSGEALEKGSDNSTQYAQILSIDKSINTYTSIIERIQQSNSFNTASDTAVSNIKSSIESVNSLILKALNNTTSSVDKSSIANEVEDIKEIIFTLANSNVNNQYLFSGKETWTQAFEKNEETGKITYIASNNNRTVNIEEGRYTNQGLNGIELFHYTKETAVTGEELNFSEDELIYDEDGNKYELLDTNLDGSFDGLFLNGNSSNSFFPITTNTDGTFTITNTGTLTLESKQSIFDDLDEVINALKQQDSERNTISEEEAYEILSSSIEKLDLGFDTVNISHSKLGTRTSTIENYASIVQAKLTNLSILEENYSGADLTKLAIESQSLENTYTALYSTINKINNLSLVKYLS